jgi:branched-chain amino acid aminotransferase
MKVWIDGRVVAGEEARIGVTDHGLLYGDGVFEGMRVAGGRVFRLERHLARLEEGARVLLLRLPLTRAELAQVVLDTVAAHGEDEAYVRLIVTRGVGPLGVDPLPCTEPRVLCLVAGITLFDDAQRRRGLDLVTASSRRPAPDVLDVRVKSLNYLGSVLAKLEARQHGADDALLLNARGHVAEAAVANVFAVRAGRLLTPPVTDGCLEGITRGAVLELAPRVGLVADERSLGRADLLRADEVFITGSGAGIVGVRSLDGRPIGTGATGPLTEHICALHRALMLAGG